MNALSAHYPFAVEVSHRPPQSVVECHAENGTLNCTGPFHEHATFHNVPGALAVGAAVTKSVGIVFHVKHRPCALRRDGPFDTRVANAGTVFVQEQSVDAAAQGRAGLQHPSGRHGSPVQPPRHRASGNP
jgi:hypothetical protein